MTTGLLTVILQCKILFVKRGIYMDTHTCAHLPGWSGVRHLCWGIWQNSLNRLTQCAADKQNRSSIEQMQGTNISWTFYTSKKNTGKIMMFSEETKSERLGALEGSRLYREGRFQRVSTLLSHGEGSTACQAAQLPPYTLPLQRVVGHPERKLQETQVEGRLQFTSKANKLDSIRRRPA